MGRREITDWFVQEKHPLITVCTWPPGGAILPLAHTLHAMTKIPGTRRSCTSLPIGTPSPKMDSLSEHLLLISRQILPSIHTEGERLHG